MIYYLPLEHLDCRYTTLLDSQLQRELQKQGKHFVIIDGSLLSTEIKTGAFLDSDNTNYFKFSQLQHICKLFFDGVIQDGDTFFVSDLWFPGIEAIKYMTHFHKITVKVKGILHAGSWTATDYVRGIEDWVQWIERGWIHSFDTIFLGSEHCKSELIEKGRVIDFLKLEVTGLPFSTQDLYDIVPPIAWDKKEEIVLFVGRMDDEKQPWIFDRLADEVKILFPQVRFIKTLSLHLSKKYYLEYLQKAKVVFSAALQENFGYGILEAAAYNCNLVLPRRLSYKEFYGDECLYITLEQAKQLIVNGLSAPMDTIKYAERHNSNVTKIVERI